MNRVLFSIGLISCVAFFSCDKKKPTPPTPPAPVNLYTVTLQNVLYYDKYPATVQALNQVNLIAQVQGYITGIYFKDGQDVKKGQVLYDIDKRLYQAAYDNAAANLKVAEGNEEEAKQDADRYEYLNSYHAVAKQLYDHAIITLQNAKNSVEAAEDQLKTARTNLSYAVITAPFDGTVGFSQVKLGNLVNGGQTVLNTISSKDPMAVDFVINEKQLYAFEKLQDNSKSYTDSLFTILMPDNSLYPYLGKISVIDRAVDSGTGTIKVRLVFANTKNELKAGMSCVVKVHNQEAAPQMLIPNRAVVEQMGEYFVFVAKDTLSTQAGDSTSKKKSDTAEAKPKLRAIQKKVQVGQTIGPNIIVLSGINEGDKIIVDGVQSVHDGSPISVGSKKPPGNGRDSSNSSKDSGNAPK